MGDVAAGELEDSLAAESVFQWLIAHGALAADKGPLAAGSTPVGVQHSCHSTTGSPPQVA